MPTRKPVASLRRPPSPQSVDEEMDAFIAGTSLDDVSSREEGDAEPRRETSRDSFKSRKPKALVKRADGTVLKQISIYLRPTLYRRLAVLAAKVDLSVSEVVVDAIEKRLSGAD